MATEVKLNLRFSQRLRRRIAVAAAKDGISLNAEIVRRLEKSFDRQDLLDDVRAALIDDERIARFGFLHEKYRLKPRRSDPVVEANPRILFQGGASAKLIKGVLK